MSETILVIDDEPIALAMNCSALRRAGYEVIEAVDGDAALAVLDGRDIAGIVCDFHMPGMNGLELVKVVRSQARYTGVPILMVSADKSDIPLEDPYFAGATGWIQKPVSAQDLHMVVRAMLTEVRDR